MTNPFEDRHQNYLVLVNGEEQHSLWPVFVDVPAGWRIAHQADTHQASLDYIEQSWTDLRPKSLVRSMGECAE